VEAIVFALEKLENGGCILADEVGLGKTIEAGLVIRQLLLSGWVKRCLILAPKSILKQWQEELYEKFALDVPRYDGVASTTFVIKNYPHRKRIPGMFSKPFLQLIQFHEGTVMELFDKGAIISPLLIPE
jgi:SNF2 family DNA or RNA helicase